MSTDQKSLAEAIGRHLNTRPNSRGNYNFRCPICGDSKRNKRKKRGWLINKHGNYSFYCHNQCGGMSLTKFATTIMPNIDVREFNLNSEIEHQNSNNQLELKGDDEELMMKKLAFTDVLKASFTPLSDLSDDHYIKSYLMNRRVMDKKLKDIFFIDDMQKFFNEMAQVFPYFKEYTGFFNGLKQYNPTAVAICYPFRDFDGLYDSFQMQISNHSQKYVIFNLTDDYDRHMYGLNDIDIDMPVFICEGTIDSLMFNNCVSSISGNAVVNIAHKFLDMGFNMDDLYLIFDRDFYTNPDVYKQFERALNEGFNLYFYDDDIIKNTSIDDIKDLNDIIMKLNVEPTTLRNFIYKNSKKEFEAMMFNQMFNPQSYK